MAPVVTLKPRMISCSDTLRHRRGMKVTPRCGIGDLYSASGYSSDSACSHSY